MKELTSPQTERIVGAVPCPLPGIIATGVLFMATYVILSTICHEEIEIKNLAFFGFGGLAIGAMTMVTK